MVRFRPILLQITHGHIHNYSEETGSQEIILGKIWWSMKTRKYSYALNSTFWKLNILYTVGIELYSVGYDRASKSDRIMPSFSRYEKNFLSTFHQHECPRGISDGGKKWLFLWVPAIPGRLLWVRSGWWKCPPNPLFFFYWNGPRTNGSRFPKFKLGNSIYLKNWRS